MSIVTKTGVVWDVETTGLDAETCDIIEVGAVKFEWDEEECELGLKIIAPRMVAIYGGLRDPGKPIPPEITKITGITEKDVKGKSLSQNVLRSFVEGTDLHVAHNAQFDKAFLTKCPFFAGAEAAPWACTIKHIDWAEKGFKSTSLPYLGCDSGFLNPFPHRAVFDCASTFRLMLPHFQELLQNHTQKLLRLYAWRAPIHTKDALKERRYFWDPLLKVWKKELIESKLESELQFLQGNVYGHANSGHEIEEIAM